MSTLTVSFPVTANVVPSNVKLPLSSSSPSVPAITTLLFVRSSTFALLTVKAPSTSRVDAGTAVPIPMRPVLTSAKRVDTPTIRSPLNVDTPLTLRLPIPAPATSRLRIDAMPRMFKLVSRTKSSAISRSPVTLRSPPTVTIPAKAAFPLTAKVIAAPTTKPPLAVTIPAAAILPLV